MSYDDVQSGCVIDYPYLWHREQAQGETAGRKRRPTAVAVRLARKDGQDALILFPLTTTEPEPGRHSVEIPEMEKRRAGLDRDVRIWMMLDEYNYDVVGRSFYLEPTPPRGSFSKAFFGPVLADVSRRLGAARRVMRGG